MFFRESDRIVESHPDSKETVESLDELLQNFPEGGIVQPDLLANGTGISLDQIVIVLNEYVRHGLLRHVSMIQCPNCSTLLDEDALEDDPSVSGAIDCTSCDEEFVPIDGSFINVYALIKPGRTRPTGFVAQPKVVFALHGINTIANWHRMFSEVVAVGGWICRTDRWYFGKFSVLRFLLPGQRTLRVSWFRREYDEECNDRETGVDRPNQKYPSIVAHSFGTYILGNALLKYDYIKFNKVILCGSILPTDFPWDKILDRGQVQYVRNDFGSGDKWSKRVGLGVRGSGPSGRYGFSVRHERLSQFEYSYEHSEYFEKGHIRSNWLSFLNQEERFWPAKSGAIQVPKWRAPLLSWMFAPLICVGVPLLCVYIARMLW